MKVFVLIELSKLKEHEEIDPYHYQELKEEIISNGFIRDPIIVDRNSNVILDGHHRFNVVKSLGLSKIPVQYIDYDDPEIKLNTWYPMILGSEKKLFELLDLNNILINPFNHKKSNGLLLLRKNTYSLISTREQVMKALTGNIKLDYAFTKELAKKLVRRNKITGGLVFPRITKDEVVKKATAGKRFPPKTTQHIILNKVRNIFIPLENLR